MSLRRALPIAAVLLAVAPAASGQCTKDADCADDQICLDGICLVAAPARIQPTAPPMMEVPPPPPPPPLESYAAADQVPPERRAEFWKARARKYSLTVHPIWSLYTYYSSISLGFLIGLQEPISVLSLPIQFEAGLTPNLSVMGLAIPALVVSSTITSPMARVGFGVRYFFFGDAPAGFYTGGLLLGGTQSLLQPGAPFSIGAELQVGYTWVWDGFTLGLGSSLYASSASFAPFGIGLTIPIGWTW